MCRLLFVALVLPVFLKAVCFECSTLYLHLAVFVSFLQSGLDLLFHPATVKPVSWQHSKIIQAFMSQGEHRQALRYIQTMKPTVSSGDDVTLHLTVLLSNK